MNQDFNQGLDNPMNIDPTLDSSEPKVEVLLPSPTSTRSIPTTLDSLDLDELGAKIQGFIKTFPEQLLETYYTLESPLKLAGILFVGLLLVAIAGGVLRVLNAVPLVAPSLELIGLGFSGWLTWRYFLYADTRQEFLAKVEKVKQKVLGSA